MAQTDKANAGFESAMQFVALVKLALKKSVVGF